MGAPRYGIGFSRYDDDPRPLITTDMSTLFVWGTSEDATPSVFPLGGLVLMNSSDTTKLAALGTGALSVAVQLINAQLGPLQAAARLVVHRVAKGASDDETIANLVGSQAAGTGIYAALKAGTLLTVVPRLFVCADGLTGKFTRGTPGTTVTRVAKFGGNTGTGLMTLAAPAFGGSVVAGKYLVRCKTPATDGGVFSVVAPDGTVLADASVGTPYTGGHIRFTIADGATDFVTTDGFDVTVTIDTGAASLNPICAALPQVLNALLAHAIVDGPGTTVQDDLDWRETLSSDRLIPVSSWVAPVGAADNVFVGPAAVVAGIGVRVDAQTRGGLGVPSQSFANQAVYGITGLKRYDSFSLTDDANDGQELISADLGIIQRGELGVETAATSSGFVLICFANAGTSDLWKFFNVGRTRDYTHLQLLKAWRQRLGVNNITLHGVQTVVNDMITVISALKRDEHIIDGRPEFVANVNSPEDIRAGRIRLGLKQEEASPLLFIQTDSRRYRDALEVLIADLASQVNANIVTA